MNIKEIIIERGEKIKKNLEHRFAFAEQTLAEPASLVREINERECEVSIYYDTERYTLPEDVVEEKDWAISKYYKAKDRIQRLSQEDRDFIQKELSALHEQTKTVSTANNSIRTLLGVLYWSTNMTVSNAVEFGSTAYLWAKSFEIEDPDTRSLALGAMALYTLYSNQWFVPTVAGVTRVLMHTIPEEIINRAISRYILKDPYPQINFKRHFLDKKNAILTLEGTGVLVLPILDLLRALKLNASYKTVEYLINLEVIKNSLEIN